MLPKPKGLGPAYAAQFGDPSVVDAYPTRPPYPPELFTILLGLLGDETPNILDLGCGTGDIARGLAPMSLRLMPLIRRTPCWHGGKHSRVVSIQTCGGFDRPPKTFPIAASMHWL